MTLGKMNGDQINNQDTISLANQMRKKAKKSRFYFLSSHAGHEYIYVKKD